MIYSIYLHYISGFLDRQIIYREVMVLYLVICHLNSTFLSVNALLTHGLSI